MVIGILYLEIYFPASHSLKEKRKNLNRLRDRLKKKFNVAYAELDFQNKWQRTKLGVVTLNAKKHIVDKCIFSIIKDVEENTYGELIHTHIDYF